MFHSPHGRQSHASVAHQTEQNKKSVTQLVRSYVKKNTVGQEGLIKITVGMQVQITWLLTF